MPTSWSSAFWCTASTAPPEELKEEVAEIAVSDEPERVYRGLGGFSAQYGRHDLLEVQNPRLRDAIIRILSSRTVEEMDSPEDREFIKDEIRFAVNEYLPEGEVLEVYFFEFFIQ